MPALLRRHLQVEDLLLFLWLVLGPIVLPAASWARASDVAGSRDPVGGIVALVALCGGAACLTSRRRGALEGGLVARGDLAYAVGPLVGAVALAFDEAVAKLGLGGGFELLPIVLPVAVAILARPLVPPLNAAQRRALVTPFILITGASFSGFLARLVGVFDARQLIGSFGAGQGAEALVGLGFALVAAAIFYVMFVFAPRQIAEREGDGRTWTVRFLIFMAGVIVGTTLVGFGTAG